MLQSAQRLTAVLVGEASRRMAQDPAMTLLRRAPGERTPDDRAQEWQAAMTLVGRLDPYSLRRLERALERGTRGWRRHRA